MFERQKEGVDLIIYGERHGFPKCYLEEAKIIKQYNPEYVLIEGLENEEAKEPEPTPDIIYGGCGISNEGVLRYKAIVETGAKVARCDISTLDKPELPTLTEDMTLGELKQYIKKLKSYIDSEAANSKREKRMGEIMVEFVKKRRTTNPVIAIIGKFHVRKDSNIYPILKTNEIDYKTIFTDISDEEYMREVSGETIKNLKKLSEIEKVFPEINNWSISKIKKTFL